MHPAATLPHRLRLLGALALSVIITFAAATAARADDPISLDTSGLHAGETTAAETFAPPRPIAEMDGFAGWQETQASAAQTQRRTACDDMRFRDVPASDLQLVLGDADIVGESDNTRFCLIFDLRHDSFAAWLLNVRSLDEFRETKAQIQSLLDDVGVDPCQIGFWDAYDSPVRRTITPNDRVDAGARCTPDVITHGPRSERRAEEVRQALATAAAAAEQSFGWTLSWPMRVHLYDDHDAFVAGMREDGGDDRATARTLEFTFGSTGFIANGMMGFLVDTSYFPNEEDLRMLASHEFAHVAQWGSLYCPCYLPFFVAEGGAEYFASLVVGPDQPNLAKRFRDAVQDEQSNRAVPLRELVKRPESSDRRRSGAAYTRGYAAMRFLAARWGEDAFTRLHMENANGSANRFLDGMEQLTGFTLDDFDRELRGFLLAQSGAPRSQSSTASLGTTPSSPPAMSPAAGAPAPRSARYVGSDERNYLRVEFSTNADGTRAEGAITIEREIPCGNSRALREGTELTFRFAIRPDGSFGGGSESGSSLTTLDVHISGSEARGTLTYTNPTTGCDTGRITFVAHTRS